MKVDSSVSSNDRLMDRGVRFRFISFYWPFHSHQLVSFIMNSETHP